MINFWKNIAIISLLVLLTESCKSTKSFSQIWKSSSNLDSVYASFNLYSFKNTSWFSDNIDSCFYKQDTVRIIGRFNLADNLGSTKTYLESETRYFNHWEYVAFWFFRNDEMNFDVTHGNGTSISLGKWSISKRQNLLKIDLGYSHWLFRPISVRKIKVPCVAGMDSLTTVECTLVMLN